MPLINVEKELVQIVNTTKTKKKIDANRGCDFCPANKSKGIKKIFNKVHEDRKILIFTTNPGPKENEEGKTLAGSAGEFLWDELTKVGISRKDCDIQNTVRCYPADNRNGELYKREPKKEEIKCCSIYNDEVKAKSKAKIYILLGSLTHKSILGREYKKSKKIFWSDTLKAKVYCLAHPNYFLGGYAPQLALTEFRDALKAVANDIKAKKVSQYAFLESQKYYPIRTPEGVIKLRSYLRKQAKKGERITVDIEFDIIDGKKLFLCCGFCAQPGIAYSVIIDHPKSRKVNGKWVPLHRKVRRAHRRLVQKILADRIIRKAFHQGSTDVPFIEEDLGKEVVVGYDYDTIYAEFFANPDRRSYGLANVALQKYPQFGDYKQIILPEVVGPEVDLSAQKGLPKNADPTQVYSFIARNNLMHFSYLPLKKLVLRNCADADITKRLEIDTRDKVSMPLLGVYRDAAFILAKMEPNGPNFDYLHVNKLKKLYPPKFEAVKKKLQKLSGKKDFNPGAHQQVKDLLYKKLKIEPPDIAYDKKKKRKRLPNGELEPLKPKTDKPVLELLSRKHEAPRLIQEYRRLGKIISTYLTAFENNANLNNGKLKTKWWLTGTQTGRLSSGGDKEVKEAKNQNINLQNIHGDPNLQNLATPDKHWRKLYNAVDFEVRKKFGNSVEKLKRLIAKVHTEKDKDKKKAKTEVLYKFLDEFKKRAYSSINFKKLCKRIIEVYGDTRVLLGFDQGQIEVRVMAQASGDENLIRDCMSGDIHSKVGHAMTGWPVEKIKKDKKTRTLTKNIHFGILFGLSAEGLMAFIKLKDPDSTITEEEAQRLYENYFKAYPGVRRFVEKMRAFVEKHGYVKNMFGFKRPLNTGAVLDGYELDDVDEETSGSTSYWGNQAINTPIQGAAHQLMLMAIAMLFRAKEKYKLLGIPTIEVHDYIGFKIKLKNLLRAFSLSKELLEKEPLRVVAKEFPKIDWKIPLVVEGKVGFRLGDSVEGEEDGKMKQMHEILFDMFIETFTKETRLDLDLAEAA